VLIHGAARPQNFHYIASSPLIAIVHIMMMIDDDYAKTRGGSREGAGVRAILHFSV